MELLSCDASKCYFVTLKWTESLLGGQSERFAAALMDSKLL